MRIVVMSDSHRRTSLLLKIIERHKDNADLFLFLGDGNDDLDNALMIYPASKVIDFAGKRILFTHGHPYYVKHGYSDIQREARSVGADICLFGHTHIPYVDIIDSIHYMNPGSVSDGVYGIVDIEPSGIMAYNAKI